MSEKIKKIICCLTACAVLTFSCVFCPRQRAEAFVLAPVVGTVAGLFALGLLCYGVSTSSDSDFVQDNAESWASSNGFFSDPTQSIMNTICASLFLSSIKLYADLAYSSGACSTEIQGPVQLPEGSKFFNSGLAVDCSSSRTLSYGDKFSNGFTITTGGRGGSLFFVLDCNNTFRVISSQKRWDTECTFRYNLNASRGGSVWLCTGFDTYENTQIYNYNLTSYYQQFLSNGFPIIQYSGTWQEYALKYVSLPVDYGISAEIAKPVIPGACDVFNSSKSLDSYHVDSPGNDVLDLGNLLDKTGCESIDDVVSKVYTGDLTASDVIGGLDCRPYVDVDVDTGTIAIPGDTTNSRPISLDKDLSIPSDIADTDTYEPLNPPKDDTTTDRPTLPKGAYAFPLADYFPFCLPFDLYRFCTLFVATPKTPEITLDFSTFLPFLDKENPEQYVYTFDLHSLDRLAEIIRTLELFGIVLGIGLITRRIIGW